MLKAMGKADAAQLIAQIKARAAILQSQTTNSTNSLPLTDFNRCPYGKCDGEGTINTIRKVQYDNYPFPVEVAHLETCECHKDKVFEKYNAASGMKPNERERTFETSDIDDDNRLVFVQCRKFVEYIDRHLEAGTWLYMYGDDERAKLAGKAAFGTGKSHLTHCIGNYLTQNKYKAIYTTEDKLFEEIKSTYNRGADETESDVLWKYENVPILLIDDMFKSKTTEWTEDKLFHLLDKRIGPGKVTIINSNYAPNRIENTLPKNGKAIASRIIGQAVMIELIGKDRRRAQAKKRLAEGFIYGA